MNRSRSALMVSLCLANAPMLLDADTSNNPPQTPGVATQMTRAIAMFIGSWEIDESYPVSRMFPRGGKGYGTEVWSAGPGGRSLIYRYESHQPSGVMTALAVLWWDSEANRFRELWCASRNTAGCAPSTADIRWEGDELVFTDSYVSEGVSRVSREVWTVISHDSHTMTISEGATTADLKPWLISRAVRSKPPTQKLRPGS